MKKLLGLFLTIVMLFTMVVPAVYATDGVIVDQSDATPIIYLRGNGEVIHYEDGKGEVARIDIDQVLSDESIYDVEGMKKEIVNILIPFISKGLPMDDWDECRKAIYNAVSPFFKQSALDGDGNPQMGTTISLAAQNSNADPYVKNEVTYSSRALIFHHDWRLDPYDNVDALHTFILKVCEKTGEKQVSFASRCLGGTLLNAYLEKYGHLGYVKNVMYCDTLANGSTVLSKLFSGKISVDGKNAQRYMGQLEYCAELEQGVGFAITGFLDEVVTSTLDLFTQTNITDTLGNGFELLYNELLQLLLPALMHAIGYATNANYWACVRDEDFDEALVFMFGEENSEAREYYAGLIEKIVNYRERVTAKLPDLYNTFINDYKIHIGTAAKYGYMNMPMIDDNDLLSDTLASLEHASFGATCAKVGETLSDEYIAARVAEGKGKYISPDKQVDLSTCISPDTAWVVKNHHHSYPTFVLAIAEEFCNGTGVTVDTSAYPRFVMYDDRNDTWSEMTADNCSDLEFIGLAENEPTVFTKLVSGIRFLTMIFKLIVRAVSGEISFDAIGKFFG